MDQTGEGRRHPQQIADVTVRTATLNALLADPRGIAVLALADDRSRIAVPDSVALGAHRRMAVPDARGTMLDVAPAGDRAAMTEAWEQAQVYGIAIAAVHALDDLDMSLTLTILDARELHGAWLMVLTRDDAGSATPQPVPPGPPVGAARPRRPTMHKTDVGIITQVDANVTAMLGWTPEQLIGLRSTEFIHPDDRDQAVTSWMELYFNRGRRTSRVRHRCADGSWLWVELDNIHNGASDSNLVDVVTHMTDISEEMAAKEALGRREQRIRALVEHSSDVVTLLDQDLRVLWQAASVRGLLGLEPGSLDEVTIISIAHPDDQEMLASFLRGRPSGGAPATLRARLRHSDGRWLDVEMVAENRFADPEVEGLVLNMRDITERKAFEDELRHQAFHDSLTGLANRALYEDRLQHALARNLRERHSLAVLFLDLDDFKTINDSLGHRFGDALLKGIAARIDPLLRPSDTAARLGGDEFAVLLDGIDGETQARAIAHRILETLHIPFTIDGRRLNVTGSIGFALNDGPDLADELLRNADIAMYAAKADGKNVVHAFEPQLHVLALERLELRSELQQALVNEEFYLDYQPIFSLEDRRATGVEALVRWQHPTRGRLAPDHFIALTEETGLIVPLGRWVLERACAQAYEWQHTLSQSQPFSISVNVAIRQLQEPGFPQVVADVLASSRLDPALLVLEITEGMLANDRDTIVRQLELLKELGLRIAVDDFGTGYSALSHLQQFPIDILKIDKCFIDDLHGDDQKASLVQAIIDVAESLNLDVIAEGIEDEQQADRLTDMHSPLGQGFLFSRPISPAAVLELMQSSAGSRIPPPTLPGHPEERSSAPSYARRSRRS
jgi:diguanylate cyclase (GGDEF)-like protein/PAS domain S-box-containing protein